MSVINGNSPELIVKNGLILNLDAGNIKSYISGSNTWYDLSGNNNNGTLTNGPTFSNTSGGTILFDGSNDYTVVSDSSNLRFGTSGFSIGFWTKPITFGSISIVLVKDNEGAGGGWSIGFASGLLRFVQQGVGDYSTGVAFSTNVWKYVMFSSSGGTSPINLYINGAYITSITPNNTQNYNLTNNLYIGVQGSSGKYFYNGEISAVQLYNRALSASEVLQNYNANKSRFATSSLSISNVPRVPTNGLVFEMDAANTKSYVSGSTNIYDISPTNLSGSLINGVGYSSANKGSLTFDGGNDYVQVSDNPVFNFGSSNFTLNLTARYSNNNAVIFGQTAFDGFAPLLMYRDGGSTVSFYISSNGTTWNLFSGGLNVAVTVNDWYDITLTRNGNVWTTYKNGQYVTSATVAGALYDSSENLKIGARTGLYNNYMSGSISTVRIYNRALSSNEVRSMYDATKARYGL